MDGKNPLITMYKHFNLLSKIGGCQDWCSEKDLNLHEKLPQVPETCASTNSATRA